ncbi:MAG: arsenate reductase ArsC [Ignavibacteria bacterium]|nr:arsenate reductase ArsC [Ignavibacteria bacterium]
MTRSVLFLCTGNSCRSQMAEGIVNHELGEQWTAYSAGTAPSIVHPRAVAAMAEIGIDISSHTSTHVDVFQDVPLDLVITVCGNAELHCPLWLGSGHRVHIGFDDPAEATGAEEEIMAVFRRVRDEIRARIVPYLAAH